MLSREAASGIRSTIAAQQSLFYTFMGGMKGRQQRAVQKVPRDSTFCFVRFVLECKRYTSTYMEGKMLRGGG